MNSNRSCDSLGGKDVMMMVFWKKKGKRSINHIRRGEKTPWDLVANILAQVVGERVMYIEGCGGGGFLTFISVNN